jgi:DNA-directed RNA polymerase subunit M/transcription elongation factor TFIIS
MEREELEQKLWDIKISKDRFEILQILAEFDRLKLRVAELAADLWDANAALDEAQSWLDRISEPAKPSPGFIGARMAAADLRQQGWGAIPEILEAIADYLDSQKPSEKPNHVHSDDSGVFWEGREEDCPICNPKHLTQCPECKGSHWEAIGHQVRSGDVETVTLWQCPGCSGQGVVAT